MLRFRPDATVEYRDIELALRAAAPPSLSPERRELLRARIFENLGAQDRRVAGFARMLEPRWVAVPVGVGIAAAVVAASRPVLGSLSAGGDGARIQAYGSFTSAGQPMTDLDVGEVATAIIESDLVLPDARVTLDAGTSFTVIEPGEGNAPIVIDLSAGTATVAADAKVVELTGPGWRAVLQEGGVVRASLLPNGDWSFEAIEGEAFITVGGTVCEPISGTRVIITGAGACITVPGGAGVAGQPGRGGEPPASGSSGSDADEAEPGEPGGTAGSHEQAGNGPGRGADTTDPAPDPGGQAPGENSSPDGGEVPGAGTGGGPGHPAGGGQHGASNSGGPGGTSGQAESANAGGGDPGHQDDGNSSGTHSPKAHGKGGAKSASAGQAVAGSGYSPGATGIGNSNANQNSNAAGNRGSGDGNGNARTGNSLGDPGAEPGDGHFNASGGTAPAEGPPAHASPGGPASGPSATPDDNAGKQGGSPALPGDVAAAAHLAHPSGGQGVAGSLPRSTAMDSQGNGNDVANGAATTPPRTT